MANERERDMASAEVAAADARVLSLIQSIRLRMTFTHDVLKDVPDFRNREKLTLAKDSFQDISLSIGDLESAIDELDERKRECESIAAQRLAERTGDAL
jgi:hypothetical protein